jgi:hydroxymethylbilane synthase
MNAANRPIRIATRGSALALAQANLILSQCRAAVPGLDFELKIIKTTGDKFQTASLASEGTSLPKGLFTKELEVALLQGQADLAVHSLKDLPTELPDRLFLAAVGKRADVRDVLIYRDAAFLKQALESPGSGSGDWAPGHSDRRGFRPGLELKHLPAGTMVATGSTRRKAQLLAHNPKLQVTDIRGNVVTRMQKLIDRAELHATVLALAGLMRLNFVVTPEGRLIGEGVPDGLLATILELDVMLPCVGQGAIGLEARKEDGPIAGICERLNDYSTMQCVTAERVFLAAMGGGCQSPVGAYAEARGEHLRLRAVSFDNQRVRRADATRSVREPAELGRQVADAVKNTAG